MSNTRDRAVPVDESLIWKRVIKQESVDHRVRTFNDPILESDLAQKSRRFFIQLDGGATCCYFRL